MTFNAWDPENEFEYENLLIEIMNGQEEPVYTPNGFIVASFSNQQRDDPEHFVEYEITDACMNVLITSLIYNDEPAPIGMEVGVFTPADLLAGAGLVDEEGIVGLSLWADERGGGINGFQEGEEFHFRIWDAELEQEIDAQITEIEVGENSFRANTLAVVQLEASSADILQHFTDFRQTQDNHSLLIEEITFFDDPAESGMEVGVFTPGGILSGAGVWIEGNELGISVWADDPETDTLDGFVEGEQMLIRLWDPEENAEYEAHVSEIQRGDLEWVENGITILSLEAPERFEVEHFIGYTITDVNHSIIVNSLMVDGENAVAGTEIGVFTTDDVLAGSEIFNGFEMVGMAAWGDDVDTDEVEGFVADEEINFRIYDPETQAEYAAESELERGNPRWTPNGFSVFNLNVALEFALVVEMREGWNIISLNVTPPQDLWLEDQPGPDMN